MSLRQKEVTQVGRPSQDSLLRWYFDFKDECKHGGRMTRHAKIKLKQCILQNENSNTFNSSTWDCALYLILPTNFSEMNGMKTQFRSLTGTNNKTHARQKHKPWFWDHELLEHWPLPGIPAVSLWGNVTLGGFLPDLQRLDLIHFLPPQDLAAGPWQTHLSG